MPTIAKLPTAEALSPTDALPIDQGNGTNAVTIATLFAGQQSAIVTPTGTLFGRVSTGTGGPETVDLGTGLVMTSGTISIGGSIASLLNGETVDQLQAAGIAADTDSFAVDQGGTSLVRQTMGAVWTYIAAKLPIATQRVVELTTNTVLDATAHNDAILVCSQPLTLSANFANMGSGFACEVLNLSTGVVTMGLGITVGSGVSTLPAQMAARLVAVTYSGRQFRLLGGSAILVLVGRRHDKLWRLHRELGRLVGKFGWLISDHRHLRDATVRQLCGGPGECRRQRHLGPWNGRNRHPVWGLQLRHGGAERMDRSGTGQYSKQWRHFLGRLSDHAGDGRDLLLLGRDGQRHSLGGQRRFHGLLTSAVAVITP